MNHTVSVSHKGEDYYTITIDGMDYGVSLIAGELVKKMLAAIINVVKSN